MKKKGQVWSFYKKMDEKHAKCKFCEAVYFNNAGRMTRHLLTCLHCPSYVKTKFKTIPENNLIRGTKNLGSTSFEETDSVNPRSSVLELETPTTSNSNFKSFLDSVSSKQQDSLTKKLALAIYCSSSPLSIVENPHWRNFFRELRPSFTLPSRYQLSHKLLEEQYIKILNLVENKINDSLNLSLQCDGWTNLRNEGIINFVITCPVPVFIDSIETESNRHTGEYISTLMKKYLDQFNVNKFLCIVTDNAMNMVRATNILKESYPHLESHGCLAHTLHLLCEDILKRETILSSINTIKNIIKVFHGHILSAEFTKLKKEMKINASLTLPCATRWCSIVTCLENIKKLEFVLKRLSIEPDFQSKISYIISQKILSEHFWQDIHDLFSLLQPITKWITIFESDEPRISLSMKAMFEINCNTEKSLNNMSSLPDEDKEYIRNKMKERQDYAMKGVHKAADLLNPISQGSYLKEEEKTEAIEFIIKVGIHLSYGENELLIDIANYRCREGFYGTLFLWRTLEENDEFNPILWWKGLCSDRPLSKIAVRILSMPPTSAATERTFSTQGSIHTNRKNKLVNSRVKKLTFIKQNQKLINLSLSDEISHDKVNNIVNPIDYENQAISESESIHSVAYSDLLDQEDEEDNNHNTLDLEFENETDSICSETGSVMMHFTENTDRDFEGSINENECEIEYLEAPGSPYDP